MTRGFLPLLAITIASGTAAIAWETDGFRVATSAGARELAIERQPHSLPKVRLLDQDGAAFSLADYAGRPLLVDFIYTRCPTLCSELGDAFHRLRGNGDNTPDGSIDLLSISFDLSNDDREALRLYGERYAASPPRWRIAAPADRPGLDAILQAFGVVVIPDGRGGFIHNGSIFLVDARGRLARSFDADAPPQVLAAALRAATP